VRNRGRVVRQLLTESVLLAGCGGISVSALGRRAFAGCFSSSPETFRLTDETGAVVIPALDWRVMAFTIGVSLLTGLLFGLFQRCIRRNRIWCRR
jgi:ABC-type antimicrobial peptide transport system permease subunit